MVEVTDAMIEAGYEAYWHGEVLFDHRERIKRAYLAMTAASPRVEDGGVFDLALAACKLVVATDDVEAFCTERQAMLNCLEALRVFPSARSD